MLSQASSPSTEAKVKPALLFVDDERRVLTSMRAMFRREYEVLLANSGNEAIDILAERSVHVVVSDQRMPEMTGVELLSTVKEEYPSSMRILLTGYADLDAVEASINESEVFRYLMKPCPTDELKDAVRLAVQAARVSELAGVAELTAVPEEELESIELVDVVDEAQEEVPDMAYADGEEYAEAESINLQPAAGSEAQPIEPAEFNATRTQEFAAVDADAIDGAAPADANASEAAEGDVPELVQQSVADAQQVPEEQPDPEVLVLTQDPELLEGVTVAIGPQYAVRDADSIESALRMLSEHPVGVLITDLAVNQEEIDELTRTLKHEVPELVTIIASERSDAALLIGLINHGQIFRFLLKPLQIAQTRIWLNSAMAKYAELCSDSTGVLRHVVRTEAVEAANSGLFASVRARIKTIKERFASSLLTGVTGLTGTRGE